jgi:hypothetical protein
MKTAWRFLVIHLEITRQNETGDITLKKKTSVVEDGQISNMKGIL